MAKSKMPQQTDKQFVDGQELLKLASLVKKNACSTELLIYLSHDRIHGSILALPKVGQTPYWAKRSA